MIFNKSQSIPPMPPIPEHPERPPPNIPIPGEPTAGDKSRKQSYRCKICGKVFNSKTELKAHLSIEHP
ncbi:C2H2-type zinc finger protein [Candidatus Bathycorpusculum sp.]|uniref:C2H2-type zinc finger protein n=1 Tax=Candidatus Bathycorpusculum sp. TaxID=2994959 RepID=UPI00281D9255|nr:C2H2-type zinc finger protein [Candidatus Termitimicrobium sp.]MCL2432211.1 C2H2-type zinc finger protein [Candidatus Termitimicrobium sp.]